MSVLVPDPAAAGAEAIDREPSIAEPRGHVGDPGPALNGLSGAGAQCGTGLPPGPSEGTVPRTRHGRMAITMGLLDRLIASLDNARNTNDVRQGRSPLPAPRAQDTAPAYGTADGRGVGAPDSSRAAVGGADEASAGGADEAAIERYRYMLRTSSPETVEQAHAEAFEQLTPEQRRAVLDQLRQGVPAAERPVSDDPHHLARAATRAEIRQPGTLERLLGQSGTGGGRLGMGGLIAGGLLASVAGGVIGSAIGSEMFGDQASRGGGEGWTGWDNDRGGQQETGNGWGDADSAGWGGGDGDF